MPMRRSARTSRAAPTRTARPCASATSTWRPTRRGAAPTSARATSAGWPTSTGRTARWSRRRRPDEPPGLDDGSAAAVLDEAEDIINAVGPEILAEVEAEQARSRAGSAVPPQAADRLNGAESRDRGSPPMTAFSPDAARVPRRARLAARRPHGGGRAVRGAHCRPPRRRSGATAASTSSTSTPSRPVASDPVATGAAVRRRGRRGEATPSSLGSVMAEPPTSSPS